MKITTPHPHKKKKEQLPESNIILGQSWPTISGSNGLPKINGHLKVMDLHVPILEKNWKKNIFPQKQPQCNNSLEHKC